MKLKKIGLSVGLGALLGAAIIGLNTMGFLAPFKRRSSEVEKL